MKVPLGGGAPVTLAAGFGSPGIALDGTSVYFLGDGVMKVPK